MGRIESPYHVEVASYFPSDRCAERSCWRGRLSGPCANGLPMNHSFHGADKSTYRKTILVAVLCCIAVLGISVLAKPQTDRRYVVQKADTVMRTAGKPASVHVP